MTTPSEQLSIYSNASQLSAYFVDEVGLISVKSYGAIGDGITNDTQAILDCLAAVTLNNLKSIFFPHGNYLVTATLIGSANFTGIFCWGDNSTLVGITHPINQIGASLAPVTTFTGLTDTPSTYSGQGGKMVAVNSGESAVEFVTDKVGSLAALTTTEKGSVVGAINEVNTGLNAVPDGYVTNAKLATDVKVGSLLTLNTTEKGSIVGAINEVRSGLNVVPDGYVTNTKLATDVKVGSLLNLTTTDKDSVVAAVNEVKSGLGAVADGYVTNAKLSTDVKVGSLAALNTTDKSNVVAAVNEVRTGLGAVADGYVTNAKLATDVKVGSLATLNTTEKASVVGAINEVLAGIGAGVVDGAVTNAKLATDVKVGSLAALNTTDKSNVVAAVNEVRTGLGAVADGYVTNAKLATDVKVGSLATLNTTEKASVVGAINEVFAGIGAGVVDGAVTNAKLATDVKVGSLAALTTTEKASVVGAINEVKTGLGAVADGYVTNAKLATDVKVGSLAALTTTEKASVVGAINEVKTGQSNVESIGRTQVEYDFNGVVLTDTTNTNNSISITPVAAKTVTANGNAKISTTEYNVGSSSGYFDGAGDTLTIADSSDFNISTGDWTIKCKIRSNNMGVRKDFVAKRRAAQPEGWNIYHASNGAICMDAKIGTYGQRLASASTFSANTWLDIQINRSGDVYRLFVDGTLEDSETISGNIDNYAVALAIGTGASTSENDFAGYIDEFEFSKGIARNTSDYTPSTDPIVPDSYTKLLLHFEGANNSTTFTDDPTQKTTATAIKSYNPINISSWSNVKWSTATPTDTSVTVDVLDSSNNVIASSITSVKDLSTINSSTYPTIKIRWTLARVTGAETSPTVTLPSLAWVGSKYLTATATYDPVSLTTGSQTSTTVTVTGAALGDFVSASFSVDNALIQVTVYVSAANTVTLVLRNGTAGTIDLASGTLTVKVWRY